MFDPRDVRMTWADVYVAVGWLMNGRRWSRGNVVTASSRSRIGGRIPNKIDEESACKGWLRAVGSGWVDEFSAVFS